MTVLMFALFIVFTFMAVIYSISTVVHALSTGNFVVRLLIAVAFILLAVWSYHRL